MSGLADLPRWMNLALIGSIFGYVVMLLYGTATGDPVAVLTADVLFGILAIAIGAVLYWAAESRTDPVRAAGASFVTGGLAQFLALLLDDIALDLLATLAVLSGVGLYVYGTRNSGE